MKKIVSVILIVMLGVGMAGCSHQSITHDATSITDPWEPVNRKIYRFNKVADKWVMKPVAKGYDKITPPIVQRRISNFFNHWKLVPTIINDLFQAKWHYLVQDTGRFVTNTTLGVFGLFDVASGSDLAAHYEDFGQTLAHWGYRNSNYIMLPLLGPSTVRDGVGYAVDSFYLTANAYIEDDKQRLAWTALEAIDGRARLLKSEEALQDAMSVDEYTFIRETYIQRRIHQLNDGQLEDAMEFWMDEQEEGGQQEDALAS